MGIRKSNRSVKEPKIRSKWLTQQTDRFLSLFQNRDKVLIVIKPDPDSIASALAIKRLLWKRVRKTTITNVERIQRLENQAMVELLKIPLEEVDNLVPEAYNRRVLVDSQPHHLQAFEQFAYDAVIDHHPKMKKCTGPYVDIRPEYGSTSAILTEYLRGAEIKPSVRLATALVYGIKTDTADFRRDAAKQDIAQFQYLFQYASISLLRNIEKWELMNSDLKYFQAALQNRVAAEQWHYAHLGKVPSPDVCVRIADFFSRVYEMGWSFVSGVYEDRLVVIIRNDGNRKNAGQLAARSFGDVGAAGGHRGAARAEIPLDALRQRGMQVRDSILEGFVRSRLDI